MHEVMIILGGNQGDVRATFKKCEDHFKTRGYQLTVMSSLYFSPSWGYESENIFYNRVFIIETNKSPQEVLRDCLDIENQLGRVRDHSGEYHDRTIDIDILFYNKEIIIEDDLIIPHPRLHERKFCLVPLNEIQPGFTHPALDKTIGQLLLECKDESKVTQA